MTKKLFLRKTHDAEGPGESRCLEGPLCTPVHFPKCTTSSHFHVPQQSPECCSISEHPMNRQGMIRYSILNNMLSLLYIFLPRVIWGRTVTSPHFSKKRATPYESKIWNGPTQTLPPILCLKGSSIFSFPSGMWFFLFVFVFCFCFVFLPFLGLLPQHME